MRIQQTSGLALAIAVGLIATLVSWGQEPPEAVPAEGRSAHFEAVASRLQLGGQLFGYIDVDGDLAKLAKLIQSQFGNAADGVPPHLKALDVERVLSDLGLGGIKAMGMSSYETSEKTHSRAFLYIPEERQGLLKVFGGDASPFTALSLAPADTDLMVEQTVDLSAAFTVVDKMIAHFGGKSAHAEYASAMAEAHPDFGFSIAEIFGKLDTRLIIVGRVHPDKPLDIDLGFACPSFDLLLALDDSAWLFEKIVAVMKAEAPPKEFAEIFVSGDGFESLTLPTMEEYDVVIMQPVLYHDLASNRIYLGSSPAFLKLCLDADHAKLAATAEFKAAVAGLPTAGNGLYFGSPNLVRSVRDLFEAVMSAPDEGPFAGLEEPDPVGDAIALSIAMILVPDQAKVIVNQKDGILISSNSRGFLRPAPKREPSAAKAEENTLPAKGSVVINELEDNDDWVELYNSGGAPVDISGWSIADGPFVAGQDASSYFNFMPGTVLAPGAYSVFTQGAPRSFTFGISGGGETVNLYSGSGGTGEIVDSTTWGSKQADKSWGRFPNGTGPFAKLSRPSKGRPNNRPAN
jgi:hypothetical protein